MSSLLSIMSGQIVRPLPDSYHKHWEQIKSLHIGGGGGGGGGGAIS